jgi:protein-S-isoprenylcysteine O-methyltransferase Ste14
MSWLIIAFIIPIPIFHLWLHALLDVWKKHPLAYYAVCAPLWLSSFFLFRPIDQLSPYLFTPSDVLVKIGYALMALGVLGIISSFLTIGPKRFLMWAVLNPTSTEQKIVHSGPFKLVPHPAYLGYLCVALGDFLASGKLYLVAALIFLLALTPLIIYFEQKELQKRIAGRA